MRPSIDYSDLVASLESRPDIQGRTVADVPELAAPRLHFRRGYYRWANVHFGFTIFNLIIAASPLVWVWPLNALAAGLSFYAMLLSERRARVLTAQLKRRASVQIARDLCGLED